MTTWEIGPGRPLRGEIRVPGDKSISHRALLLGAIAGGPCRVRGLLAAQDVDATAAALGALGVQIARNGDEVLVEPPPDGLCEPGAVLECGNSGTTMRLVAGLVAPQSFLTVLTGDASLRARPMARILDPLRKMGAKVDGREGGTLPPIVIRGKTLKMVQHELPVASAQVKSALLVAGLRCGVAVKEPHPSRDHTERMLLAMGAALRRNEEGWLVLLPTERLLPFDVDVPGDLSAAANWLVGACVVPGSEVFLPSVGMNPTRAGVLKVLEAMGADVQVYPVRSEGPEPRADLRARHGKLVGTHIEGALAVQCIDEIPILAVAAACAEGETVIRDAAELRVKESDRISRLVAGLRAMGIQVEERADGMAIRGGSFRKKARIDARGDHRIAMAFAIAAMCPGWGAFVEGAESVKNSYPGFREDLEVLRAKTHGSR